MAKQSKNNGAALRGFALTLVILILAVCVMAAMTNGFTEWNPYGWFDEEPAVGEQPDAENSGGMVTEVQSSTFMKLAAAATTAADGAESTTTLTATIAPEEATNKSVDWEIAFVNPDSAWATGKTVTDYVTLTPASDGALTATVNCLQPFGEQIMIKVTSRDNPDASATCTVDYLQKVSNVSLRFGEKQVNLGGDTNFVWEINENGAGEGGAAVVNYDVSEVYTIAGNYTYTISTGLTLINRALKLNGKMLFWSDDNLDIKNDGFTLDYDFLINTHCYVDGRTGSILLADLSPSQLLPYFQNIDESANVLTQVTLTISGANGKVYEYTSNICVTGYTNTALVTNVSLNASTVVF